MKRLMKLFDKNALGILVERRFAVAMVMSFLLILTFDVLWSSVTTFRGMSFVQTYIYALLGAIILSLPAALAPRRAWIQLAVWIVSSGVMIANMMYYRTYFTSIPAASYLMVGNLADFRSSVTDSLALTDVILPLVSVSGYIWLRHRQAGPRRSLLWLVLTVVLSLAAWISALPYGGMFRHIHQLSQECYYANCPPVLYTLAGPVAAEVTSSAEKLSERELADVDRWMTEHRALQAPPLHSDGSKSLVMIFLESFETWPIGLKVEGKKVTPFIDSLLADSTVSYFPNIVTQVGAGRSIDAQLLMLCGMIQMSRDVAAMSKPDNSYYSIPKAMKEAGAKRAYLLTGDKNSVWNQARFARSMGVDTLLDARDWEMTEKIGNPAKLADRALFSQAVAKMRSGEIFPVGEQAYVQIVAYSGHNPWQIPADQDRLKLRGAYPEKYAEFLTAANYVDGALSELVGYLRSRSDANNIVIAIVGDHEGLASYRAKLASDRRTAGKVDTGEHTPLIVVNSYRPGCHPKIAGQVDVYTTLLDILGLDGYVWRGMGRSILDEGHPGEAVGSDGKGSTDSHLQHARTVSDIVIRHNLLDHLVEDEKDATWNKR